MTSLQLQKYIQRKNIKYRWDNNDRKDNERDVIIFLDFSDLKELCKMLTLHSFDEGGIPSLICDGYICVWANDLCWAFDIDKVQVFGPDYER